MMLLVVLLCSISGWSQKRIFDLYSFQVEKLYGIEVTKPEGFKVLSKETYPLTLYTGKGTFWQYAVSLVSEDENCLLLYPYFNKWGRDRVYEELKASLGENPLDKGLAVDTGRYVRMFTRGREVYRCGADTVVVCRMQLPEGFEYKDKYPICVSVNLHKQGHPIGMMKMLLTEEGSEDEEVYLSRFIASIRYADEVPVTSPKRTEQVRKQMNARTWWLGKAAKKRVRSALGLNYPLNYERIGKWVPGMTVCICLVRCTCF